MTSQNGRAFNEWLRAQLKAKKMSQRQLAQQSGVDHSTISRLIRGDRMPSLGTAHRPGATHEPHVEPAAALLAALPTAYQGTTRMPSTSGSRGQRTPAFGPAFAIQRGR